MLKSYYFDFKIMVYFKYWIILDGNYNYLFIFNKSPCKKERNLNSKIIINFRRKNIIISKWFAK